MKKPLIYLAGPYTKGDMAMNVRSQILLHDELMRAGIVTPYAPLMTHFVHMLCPNPYEAWMSHSFEMLEHCDAVLSADACEPLIGYRQVESSGRDREIAWCIERGVRVFHSVESLNQWATTVYGKAARG